QVAWLTLPLVLYCGIRHAEGGWSALKAIWRLCFAFMVGVLVWLIPLVVLSGGPSAYARAVFGQGSEDLADIQMFWTTPTVQTLVDSLYYAFVAPWVTLVAALVLVLAVAGAMRWARVDRSALVLLAAAYLPYLIFDIVFQETFTGRYALPLVIPIAFLAADTVA